MGSVFGKIDVETPTFTVVTKAQEYEIRQYAKQIRAETTCEIVGTGMGGNLNTPFRTLAGYIFGGNVKKEAPDKNEKVAMTAPVMMNMPSEKVAMTAPVIMTKPAQEAPGAAVAGTEGSAPEAGGAAAAEGGSGAAPAKNTMKMAFIMPSKHTLDTLPIPKDARVKLVEVPEHKMAVTTFSGSLDEANMRARERELRAAAARDGVKLSEDPAAVAYAGYNPPWCLPYARTNEVLIPVLD